MRLPLLVALACAACLARAAEQTITEVTILSDAGYPPYSYEENGEARGLYTDILRNVFARMPEYRVRIRPTPWPRGLAAIAKGSAFAIYPPYSRPDERPWMEYSAPILAESLIALIRPGLIEARNFSDFPNAYAGLRIGLNSGFAGADNQRFRDMVESGEIDLSYARDNRLNLLKLLYGRTDVYINDRLSILWELERMHKEGLINQNEIARLVWGPVLSSEHGYLGFTRMNKTAYPYRDDFMQRFNQQLEAVVQDGTLQHLLQQYNPQSITTTSAPTP